MSTLLQEEHKVVTREEWLAARKELLKREKAHTREADAIAAARRELPWVRVDKDYVFEGPEGKQTLAELFGKNSQLFIYHFMLAPGWEEGCDGCSFLADHIDGANQHIKHHDVTLMCVSRAPLAEIQAFKKRMGWQFKWVSSHGSDFNFDYSVSFTPEQLAEGKCTYNFEPIEGNTMEELPGMSVFYKNEAGEVFHTYSAYARGGDILLGAHNFLDMTPKGRNEDGIMSWVRYHDKYEDAEQGGDCACCG